MQLPCEKKATAKVVWRSAPVGTRLPAASFVAGLASHRVPAGAEITGPYAGNAAAQTHLL